MSSVFKVGIAVFLALALSDLWLRWHDSRIVREAEEYLRIRATTNERT